MGIYIKGMEMPKEGTVIAIYKLNGKFYASVHGTELCPLVPVPPHGRLIDVDAPMRFEIKIDGGMNMCVTDIYAPTIIEAEDHIGDANEMVGDSE